MLRSVLVALFVWDLTSLCRAGGVLPVAELRRDRRAVIAGPRRLIDEVACPEVSKMCSNLRSGADDLFVLECIQSFTPEQLESLSETCKHTIWEHTSDIMRDENVRRLTVKTCGQEEVDKLDCKVTEEIGHFLACVLDRREDVASKECRSFIQRLEWVAFSDFRLIGPFMHDCEKDIVQLGCGRVQLDRTKLSQGETLACLQSQLDKLNNKCRKGVFHLSEMQSDNMKFDRQLFLACVTDSERFCPQGRPGSGAVYKCLIRHVNHASMSQRCQEQLTRREKLIAHDYKVSRGLARACRDDIRVYHCRRGVSDDKEVRLAQILLCLEAAQKNSSKITPECLAEMTDHRKLLMEDYKLSPEILAGCQEDIAKFCGNIDSGSKTIHCLMDHARPKRKKERRVSPTCERAVEQLVKVADVGEDWRVDPVLRDACKPVVDVACRDTEGGDARVMSCLMEKLSTSFMTQDCEAALLQIQYFVARDFKLDPQLYRHCKEDAVRLCHAKKAWADVTSEQMDPERGPLVLPCLHRYAYHASPDMHLRPECFHEVKRVMRQRAIAVDLIPEVEDECLDDLTRLCHDKTGKGEEMQCLQDNLEKLDSKCLLAVEKFTEEEAGHVELNSVIMMACRGAMEHYCDAVLKSGTDEGEMMECLISHKNDPGMREDLKCRAAVEHFQIISLKNYHFTFKFKEACKTYVTRFCPASNTKYEVVACLSERMRNDTLKGQRHTIPKECRQQVRSQLYQQRENIDYDPRLKSVCREEIDHLCYEVPNAGGQILECLQRNTEKLSPPCRHALFSVRRSELMDSATDYTLINACREMLQQFCPRVEQSNALQCLKVHREEPMFDQKCHYVVVNRMIEQNLDYRFNPQLQDACRQNIANYCTDIVASAKKNEELNGKVVNCLKAKFREGKLTHECKNQMTLVLREQALNYKLNPLLQNLCRKEIQVLCRPTDEIEDHGRVEDCLKEAFLRQQIITKECKIEVATLIQEAKADIHVDPLLQQACTSDLLRYCSDVMSGDGRQLRCLQTILSDQSKALEENCRQKLLQRVEMFKNAAPLVAAPENLSDLYTQVSSSPAKKFFFIAFLTFVGFIFIFGLFCGRATRRTIAMKNK
ncbi:Golgi apparatus protein 1 isoform X2 [Phlebotomus argentipes]|uniref:Golgi apparatus protein 1 isoform X2 n=1 Tax=Phlebotomus argentipes TaxID=94469 RepID=UPI00289367D2|nr:Golgi apparatus protein 1 isoform X2 [Phlebotomus argentipes]